MRAEKYSEQMTVAEIARELRMSIAHTHRILIRAINKFRRGCERRGIDAGDVLGVPTSMIARMQEWA